ncbi:MAG TPA: heme exporter protein CcmD [Casimicrobiaceae bacterium]|jgi:heme exporter protein D|nr:heme exporter protein CcmD [Casimicrobiaceae bacterium]
MSLGDFFAMGGYGFYVWGAYAVTAALIAVEIVAVRARYRAAARLAAQPGDAAR